MHRVDSRNSHGSPAKGSVNTLYEITHLHMEIAEAWLRGFLLQGAGKRRAGAAKGMTACSKDSSIEMPNRCSTCHHHLNLEFHTTCATLLHYEIVTFMLIFPGFKGHTEPVSRRTCL